MNFLEKLSALLQQATGTISSTGVSRTWLIIGAVVLVAILVIFTLDRSKSVFLILLIYCAGFAVLYIQPVMEQVQKRVTPDQLRYAQIVWTILPIVALIVHKRKKRRAKPSGHTRRSGY